MVLAAAAAAFAPFSPTGNTVVDVIERMVVVAAVAFAGAHGHRRQMFLAAALSALPARGVSLVLVLVALLASVAGTRTTRRSKALGAVTAGALANAVLWYPPMDPAAVAPVVGLVVYVVLFTAGVVHLRSGPKRALMAAAGTCIAVVAFSLAATGWVALTSRGDVEAGTSAARAALAAVRRGDSAGARAELALALEHLDRADERLNGPLVAPAGAVPGLAQQVHAVQLAVDEGLAVSRAADDLVATDYDSLRYNGRIDLDRVTVLQPQAERVRTALATAERRLAGLDDVWLVSPLRTRVDDFQAQVAAARDDADLAGELVDLAPGLLGGNGTRRYLIVFLQPAELRGAGGFVGNWAELEASDGDVDLSRSGRIKELIDAAPPGTRSIDGPADYVRRYGPDRPTDNLQDVTLSPNWPSVASVYAQLYPQSGGREVDGVIGVDPTGLAALLDLTGPVTVPQLGATKLTSENAVELLTIDQYLFFGDSAERADILEAATRATFQKLTDAALPAPRKLGDLLGPAARGRHLQLWSPRRAEQALFHRIGTDGRLAIPRGHDGMSIIQQNVGNSKIDAFLERTVAYRATVDARTGALEGEVHVTLRNTVPLKDVARFPRAVVGNNRGVPNGTNLSRVSLVTPQAVTSVTIDGRSLKPVPVVEAGQTFWDLPLVQIPAGGQVEIVFELRGGVDLRGGYRFDYLPQPMVNPDQLDASVSIRNGTFQEPDEGGRLRVEGPAGEPVALRSGVDR
ncbi:MAG: arsenical pump rane protein [Acidimicrobiales bacterium]|nr:arsenical pump rane protein [Acidimicrobiales bacterium]